MKSFSVVICSIDAAKFQRASASWQRTLQSAECEIVGIHDARSLAEGYTRGLARARGDVIVFSHDDVDVVTPDAAGLIESHLERFDVIGIAGTTRLVGGDWHFAGDPYAFMLVISPDPATGKMTLIGKGAGPLIVPGIQALDGVVFAARRGVAREIGFDSMTFDHFHLYDLDFTFRAFLAGKKLAVCRDLLLVHTSQGSFDARWDMYRMRFEAKFAGQLAAPPQPRRKPRILNAPLDSTLLNDPARRAELARVETLQSMFARLDSTTKTSS
ncbi:MAG TPA: glycosyltransferase [Casimicrobiaceae bacterium]|nr:glycosyltransferase [Casimicrobiaceae bacterium]